jgi:integrase
LDVFKSPGYWIFPIPYEGARVSVAKAGKLVGIKLRPHDLHRHSATYASRSGVPIEIVNKVILRHANLSTTQRYLGTISDVEAIRWIENIFCNGGGEVDLAVSTPNHEMIRIVYLKNLAI